MIGGKPRSAAAYFERLDPISGEVASTAAAASQQDALAAAFPAWSERGPYERRALLIKAAGVLESKAGDFVAGSRH